MPLIQLDNVYKIYKAGDVRVHALDGVSLTVEQGDFAAVVGGSGSGKSTLMNILGCLDAPSMGKYFLDGKDVSRLTDQSLSIIRNRKIGFVFQGFNLVSSLDALENVELPLIYRGMSAAKRRTLASAALHKVGLSDRMHHRPGQMSGGQQQRVAIARAVAAKPPILLADEPTGNLDTKAGSEVMEILTGLHREGVTVILITHDRDIAAMAPRNIVIRDGRILQDTGRTENKAASL